MKRAHANPLVFEIAETLFRILNQELFRSVAFFLNKYNQGTQPDFAEALSDLRTSTFPGQEGTFTVSDDVDKLVQNLNILYQQSDKNVGFFRGAILEKLAFRLLSQRCLPSECYSNQVILDEHGREATGQIDVGALSNNNYFIEGYECKTKAKGIYGLASEDCDNLRALVRVAHHESYNVHVGVISFDSDNLVKSRLKHYNAPRYIKAYGLDSIRDLRKLPHYITPDDDLGNIS